MRSRYKPWAIPELEKDDRVYFDPIENKGKWSSLFKNKHPIFLEIGSGLGGFILQAAETHPETNFIAMEMNANVLVQAARDFRQADLGNLLAIRSMAEKLEDFFDEDELDGLFLNFSNPWPARRHHKRRLTHPRKLQSYEKILKNHSLIYFKTDNDAFFKDSLSYFEKSKFQILRCDFDLPAHAPMNILTEYEKKWRSQGVKIKFAKLLLDK